MIGTQGDKYKLLDAAFIIREVKRTCHEFGFTGDVLIDVPRIGTLEQEKTIIALFGQTPPEVRRNAKSLAQRLVRNAVLNDTGGDDG